MALKIFLIQSYLGRAEAPIYPLGLAYLGACLKGHEVCAYDPNVASDPYGKMASRLEHFQPDVVGISLRNIDTTQYRDPYLYTSALRPTLEIVKKHAPAAHRVIGGSGFSIYAQAIMQRFPEIDFGVLLEAEESFPALLNQLDYPERVPGIYYRSNGLVQLSAAPRLPDFDALPSPRWDIVDLEPYTREFEAIGIQAKRGCGLRCAYCTYYFLNGSHYRLRSPEKIVAEIADLKARFKIERFMFVDSIFNIPQPHAERICQELIRQKLNLRWAAWFNERVLSQDFYRLAREAGCHHFIFSPDAYSDRWLKILDKNLRVKDITKAFEIARNADGGGFAWNFFVNPPGQTYGDFFRLMLFGLKVRIQLRKKFYGLHLGNIRLEPETQMCRLALEQGVIKPETDLLPESVGELRKLFYTNPETPLINLTFKVYDRLAALKHRIAR